MKGQSDRSDLLQRVVHALEGEEIEIRKCHTADGLKVIEVKTFGMDRWLDRAHERGIVTAVEFLALIDDALFFANPETDEEEAIAAWSAQLRQAVAEGKVCPIDPKTYLPCRSVPEGWDWMIDVAEADEFLATLGHGWSCRERIDGYWKRDYAPQPATAEASKPPAVTATAPASQKVRWWGTDEEILEMAATEGKRLYGAWVKGGRKGKLAVAVSARKVAHAVAERINASEKNKESSRRAPEESIRSGPLRGWKYSPEAGI